MGALTVEAKYMHLCVDLNPVILPPYVRRALPIFLCKKGDQLSITLKTTGYVECGFYCMNTDSAYGIPNKKGTFTFLMTVPSDGSYQFWVRNNEGKFINMQGAVYWTKCGAGWKK